MLIDYLKAGLAIFAEFDWNYRIVVGCKVYLNYLRKFFRIYNKYFKP